MFVNFKVANERYTVCKSCQYFSTTIKSCAQCGCFMPVKVTIATMKCPMNYWSTNSLSSKDRDYKIDE